MIEKKEVKKAAEFELPENYPYKLPKHISWTKEIYDQVSQYGLFYHAHQTYVAIKDFDKKNDEGMVITHFKFQKVANFTVRIIQHMEDEKTPMKLIELKNEAGRHRIFDCPSSDLSSLFTFKKLVEGRGNYHFTGRDIQFEKIKGMIMEEMGDGRMITVLGWQQEGFFAFNNGALKAGSFTPFDEYGRFELEIKGKRESFYVPSANKIYRSNVNKFLHQKKVRFEKSEVHFSTWASKMMQVHRSHAMTAIAFGISCLFSDLIFRRLNFFPMIFLYGEASTGKGNLIRSVQTLFGDPQDTMTITGSAHTDKAKIRKFAQFNNMVVFLDEYNNSLKPEMIEMLKGLWDRHGYERGNIDSAFGTDTVPISSGVMMTGNDYPSNEALITRLIVEEMNKSTFSEEEKHAFDDLSRMINQGYSSILSELLVLRTSMEDQFTSAFQRINKELTKRLGSEQLVSRMIDNVAVLIATCEIAREKLKFPFTQDELINHLCQVITHQNEKRDTGGEVTHFWECFTQSIRDFRIRNEKEFKIDGDNLFIFWKDVHSAYRKSHFDLYRKNGLERSTMMDKLRKSTAFVESRNSIRIGGRKSSGFQFSCRLIDEDFADMIMSLSDALPSYGSNSEETSEAETEKEKQGQIEFEKN